MELLKGCGIFYSLPTPNPHKIIRFFFSLSEVCTQSFVILECHGATKYDHSWMTEKGGELLQTYYAK